VYINTERSYPNWFNISALSFFKRNLVEYAGVPNLNFLQIGAYTGDASVWLMNEILTDPTSYLHDVDTWEGSEEAVHKAWDWNDVESVYDKKIQRYKNIVKHKSYSSDFLKNDNGRYDFIYIDGDHTASGVYDDAVGAWPLLKSGGIMAFDDYHWHHESGLDNLRPAPGIDRFISENREDIHIIEIGYQYWIGKK